MPSSSEAVMAAAASPEVMTPLLEAAGEDCWRRMEADLFPLVDGGDADAVWSFVALVDKVGGTASVFGTSKKQLKKVVEKLRTTRLDFKVLLRGDADQIAEKIVASSLEDEISEVGEMLQKLGRHSELLAEVRRCVGLKRIFARLRLGAAPEEAVGDVLQPAELEGVLSRLCFSAPYAPKLSAPAKMGLLDAFIDDVEAAWDWKAFLEATAAADLRALYRRDDGESRLYHALIETRGERAAVLALLPRHFLALEWECEQLQAALDLLSCDGIEPRTLLLSCLEEEEELFGAAGEATLVNQRTML